MSDMNNQPPPSNNPPPPQPGGGSGGIEGLDPKVAGLLAYLLFGWIGGLIMYLTQKHPIVRFHGAQSVLLSIVVFVFYIVLGLLTGLLGGTLGMLAIIGLINLVFGLAILALWVFLCIKGYNLEKFKLPVIGDIAETWAAK